MKYTKMLGVLLILTLSACTNAVQQIEIPQEKLLVNILNALSEKIQRNEGNSGIQMTCGGSDEDFACYIRLQNIEIEEVPHPDSKKSQLSY